MSRGDFGSPTGRNATAVGTFSPRARSGFPDAAPVSSGYIRWASVACVQHSTASLEDSPAEGCMSKTANRAPASVAENVETVLRVENETQRPRSRSEAITDVIGGFVGTISFVAAQLIAFAAWVIVNAATFSQLAPFDPFPYPLLSSITSLEAVLLAAFVLMKQNRMGMVADRRDHLDLQVNLLTEQRAAQIIQMLDRLSARLGVEQHQDETSRELGRRVAVEHLVEELHRRLPDASGR